MHNDSTVKQLMYKVASLIPDKVFLSLKYRKNFGRFPDWKNPKTFCEKINWLKLYDRNPLYTRMVDKYEAKEYVANIIGRQYIIPTLGVWDSPDDIDFDSLPNQFVLKATHDSGRVVICTDKSKFDRAKAVDEMRVSLKRDFYAVTREWPYKNVKRRIIAEAYIAPHETGAPKDLPDYKFFCFNGEPKYCQVIRDRSTEETIDFYDTDWVHQEFVGLNPVARNGLTPVARPGHLDDMIAVCRKLAKDVPFVRVDLYEVDGNEYFGELTFYPNSGMGVFTPEEWSERLGELIKLPTSRRGGVIVKIVNGDVTILSMSNGGDELKDYKFFCFNGKVRCFKIDFGRFIEHHANYYAPDGELLPFGEVVCPPVYEHKETIPDNLDDMIEIAERLSRGLPFLRVDLYNMNGHIYFGELTFFPNSGMGAFTDEAWDKRFGDWISL